jgi:hypothetical protein
MVVLALPATGMAQSTSTCTRIGNVTNCQHQPNSAAPLDYGAALQRGQHLVPDYQEQQARQQQIDAARAANRDAAERLSCRKKAMAAIDAGEYEKAKALADLCP